MINANSEYSRIRPPSYLSGTDVAKVFVSSGDVVKTGEILIMLEVAKLSETKVEKKDIKEEKTPSQISEPEKKPLTLCFKWYIVLPCSNCVAAACVRVTQVTFSQRSIHMLHSQLLPQPGGPYTRKGCFSLSFLGQEPIRHIRPHETCCCLHSSGNLRNFC